MMTFNVKYRLKYSNVIKLLIDCLREEPCTRKKLRRKMVESFPEVSGSALSHGLGRCLEKLKEWGLVTEWESTEGKNVYYWYFYPNLKEPESYQAKVEHSRKLIPALKLIAELRRVRELEFTDLREMRLCMEAAEEHLKYYPEIWGMLDKYRGLVREADEGEEEFRGRIEGLLRERFGDEVREYSPKHESFVSIKIPYEIYSYINGRLQPEYDEKGDVRRWLYIHEPSELKSLFKVEGEELWFRDVIVAKGISLHQEVRKLIEDEVTSEENIGKVEEIRWKRYEAYAKILPKLQDEISSLIHRIECGEPLKGRCSREPEIIVEKATSKS
jgi:hypothetical protein